MKITSTLVENKKFPLSFTEIMKQTGVYQPEEYQDSKHFIVVISPNTGVYYNKESEYFDVINSSAWRGEQFRKVNMTITLEF